MPSTLWVGLGQHPVHVEHFDARVDAPCCTQLAVRTKSAAPAIALVAGHIGSLVKCWLRGIALHLGFIFEVQARPKDALGPVLHPVLGLGLPLETEGDNVHEPVRGGTRWIGVHCKKSNS